MKVIRSHVRAHGETVSTWVRRLALEALEDEGVLARDDEGASAAPAPTRPARRVVRSA
jgi:hypothetical protein